MNKYCESCGKKLLYNFGSGRFCNRSCANRRKMTSKIKSKISKTMTKELKEYNHICYQCNKAFKNKNKNSKFCSKKCLCDYRREIEHNKISSEEWSKINRRSYELGRNYVAGGTVKWYNYKNIKVQGTFELRTCYILDKLKENKLIHNWEYTNDKIRYLYTDNKLHNYLLDFKVFNKDNSFYYIEVKGFKTLKDELKWKAAKEQNIKLVIWFEKDIIKYEKLLNINMLP